MAIDKVGLTTAVTGTLPVANGGTNLTSGFENGGLVHINTQTVSGAVSYVNFDNQLSSTYDTYVIQPEEISLREGILVYILSAYKIRLYVNNQLKRKERFIFPRKGF